MCGFWLDLLVVVVFFFLSCSLIVTMEGRGMSEIILFP